MNPSQRNKPIDASNLFRGFTGERTPLHDMLAPHSDSQELMAREVAWGLELRGMSAYTLHEQSGVAIDTIMEILRGTYDLADSLPITAIEQTLKIPLRHL